MVTLLRHVRAGRCLLGQTPRARVTWMWTGVGNLSAKLAALPN